MLGTSRFPRVSCSWMMQTHDTINALLSELHILQAILHLQIQIYLCGGNMEMMLFVDVVRPSSKSQQHRGVSQDFDNAASGAGAAGAGSGSGAGAGPARRVWMGRRR